MLCKNFYHASFLRFTLVLLTVSMLAMWGFAQDPTGRPPDPKGKKPTTTPVKKPPVKAEPITITLTVLTTPHECAVFINGEQRGVTKGDGKVQFEKLAQGHYSIEVRKDGYTPMLRGFDAGTESPTLVFKLEPKLDDYIREFNSLIGSGKLAGPQTPNAFELVEKLAITYGDRAEVTTLKSVLAAKLGETITPIILRTVTNWRGVTREQMMGGHDAATNALALNKDDTRIQAQAAYLRGAAALREWQATSASMSAKGNGGQGDATGSVGGPATARAEFDKALKLDDSLAAARYQLGVVLLASSDVAGAEAAFLKVTQVEPKWAPAYTGLGQAYYSGAKFNEAIAAFQRAISIDPNSAAAVANLGLARTGKGEKDGVKDIERAMKLDPNSAVPHLNMAIVLSQSKNKKDWSRAEDEFKKAIQLNSQNFEFQNVAAEKMLADVQKRKK